MYKKIWIFIFLVGNSMLYGQDYYSGILPKQGKIYETNPSISLINPKNALYKAGDYWGVINQNTGLTGEKNPRNLYNIAASYDKLEMPDETMFYLYQFMEVSQDDREILIGNDFPNLKSHPDKWEKITKHIDSLFLVTIGEVENKELALKIFHLAIDYKSLAKLSTVDSTGIIWFSPDKKVVAKIGKILKKYGFPTEKMVGRYGVFNVFDIVHHTDLLDKHYHRAKTIFKKGALDSILYALMTDRVLGQKNKKQIYGTQWTRYHTPPKGELGKYVKKYPDKYLLLPVKGFEQLNERRKQMGFTDTIEEMMEANKEYNYFIPPEYYEKNKKKQP